MGDVIRCWDIESDSKEKVVYESGSCLTKYTNRKWRNLNGESKSVLHHTSVNHWVAGNCAGLAAECATSTKTFRDAMDEDIRSIMEDEVKIIKPYIS